MIEVPEFEAVRVVGMAVRLALHIRGLPAVNYETLKLVAVHMLSIPSFSVQKVVETLAEVEFVKLQRTGKTITAVVPNVPYYETLYSTLGTYANDQGFNEAEQLSVTLLCRLAKTPEKLDTLRNQLGVEKKLLIRAFDIGDKGSYLRVQRARGRDIAVCPTYFSENADVFVDLVAGASHGQVRKVLGLLRQLQGVPLSVVQAKKEIAGTAVSDEEIRMLVRLAHDGAVKPPCIKTEHAGENFFLFTPTPTGAALAPTKRDIYERAMAIVAAVRQGQYLSRKYAIRSPGALLYKLMTNMKLAKATTEAAEQYRKLVYLRVAQLADVGNGYCELRIIDTEENRLALEIAYNLVDEGVAAGVEVDDDARRALQQEHSYVESLVASSHLRQYTPVRMTEAQQLEIDTLFLK